MGAKLRIVWERYYCSENTNAVLPIKDLANQKIAYLKWEMQQTIHFIYIKNIRRVTEIVDDNFEQSN
jgi:hypothetical protein